MPSRVGKFFAVGAGFYIGFVFIRNGTAPKLINDTARGAKDFVSGTREFIKLA